jgi:hypothetical protein
VAAPAQNQDVEVWRGQPRQFVIPIKKSDGTFLDLTNGSARYMVARSVITKPANAWIDKEPPLELREVGGDDFWCAIVDIDPEDTVDMPAGRWYHELQAIDAENNAQPTTIGEFWLRHALIPPPA